MDSYGIFFFRGLLLGCAVGAVAFIVATVLTEQPPDADAIGKRVRDLELDRELVWNNLGQLNRAALKPPKKKARA